MKNTIFFLATIFVLQSSTFMFGQVTSLSKDLKLFQIHQINLASAEMMSIVNIMSEKSSLLESELNLQAFEIKKNDVVTNSTFNWNAPNFQTVAHKDFFSATSLKQFEELHTINHIKNLKWNKYEKIDTNISLQNFVGENPPSLMQSQFAGTSTSVELGNKEWIANDGVLVPTNNVQLNNWQGQMGRGVGSYY